MSNTLHIAVRVNNSPYSEIADSINNCCSGVFIVADTSGDGIKEWVRQHLKGSPGERWLILSGTVIGEIAPAPVRFRAV